MVLVQKWPFFEVFFLGIIDQENVFYDILDEKNAFLGYRNKKFEQSKNRQFSKGVNPSFYSQNGHFFNFFCLGNKGQENVFYNILAPKNGSLAYENKKLKKSKNWHFPKGLTHGFGPKIGIFSTFFV